MKIKPLIKIEINSLNQEKIFNKLLQNNIEIYDIKRIDKAKTLFEIETKHFAKTKKILSNNSVKITNKSDLGLTHLKSIFLLRLGVFIGILFSLILCIFASFFVLKIDIVGTDYIEKIKVLEYLYSQNIDIFSTKSNINCTNLELELFESFNEISMVSVSLKGATLLVNIKEKSLDEINAENKYSNIVSNFNGRIIELDLVSGTAVAGVGDIVQVGDILVKAEIKDSSGTAQPIEAKAEIYAEIWSEFRYTHYEQSVQVVETGKQISSRQISIFGIVFFDKVESIEFEKYKTEISEIKLKNVILPIKIKQTIYKELKEIQITSNFEEEKEQIINECKQNALQNLKNSDIIKSEDFSITDGQGFTNVCYVIIAERKVF